MCALMNEPIFTVTHQPMTFAARTAFPPLIEALHARPVYYRQIWEQVQKKSWTLGYLLRKAGNLYYGSSWNALVPFFSELSLLAKIDFNNRSVVHWLWGDFARPSIPKLFKKNNSILIGTYHSSVRRQPSVLFRPSAFRVFDGITVVSEKQIPYFLEHGVSPERIRTILLGVDTEYFCPLKKRNIDDGPIRAVMVGNTERDHEFMSSVLKKIPNGIVHLSICTSQVYHHFYDHVSNCTVCPRLSDQDLLALYQNAELLIMPMIDCTANDVILESMACGTPLMINKVGGVSEYVDPSCGYLMEDKDIDNWIDQLRFLQKNKNVMESIRPEVRKCAAKFDWNKIANEYMDFYKMILNATHVGG